MDDIPKKRLDRSWQVLKILISIVCIAILLIFLWAFFTVKPFGASPYSGFSEIKPSGGGTVMFPNGTFVGVFYNHAGSTIVVDVPGIIIEDASGLFVCDHVILINSSSTVPPEGYFKVEAYGCITGRPGDVYDIRITIPYTIESGGTTLKRVEHGKIRDVFQS